MSLRFIDGLPVLGYADVEDRTLAFAWQWHAPTLRVTFTGVVPSLVGQLTHLDGLPRLAGAPDNHDWLDPARTQAVLDHAIDLWRRKEHLFRHCND